MNIEQFMQLLAPLLETVIGALALLLGYYVKKYINSKIDKDKQAEIRENVKAAVEFVEQISKTDLSMHGAEKFQAAKDRAVLLLNEKGISVTELQLETLIESFVQGMGNADLKGAAIENIQTEEIAIEAQEVIINE